MCKRKNEWKMTGEKLGVPKKERLQVKKGIAC